MRLFPLGLTCLLVLSGVTGSLAQTPVPAQNLPALVAALISPASKVKSVEQYPSGLNGDGKAQTLYVVHLSDGAGGKAGLFMVDSDSRLVWSRVHKPEPVIVGTFRNDVPPVFGYPYYESPTADFTAYKLLMWDGRKPRIVFDGSSGAAGETPSFVDLRGDGTREMVFYNRGSKHYDAPSIFVWNEEKQRLEYGELRFPNFWKKLIKNEMDKLQDWQYSKAHSEDLFVDCAWLASYLRESGRTDGINEFFRLAIEKLDLFAEKTGDDDLRQRADDEKNHLHFILSGPISGLLQDFYNHCSHWPSGVAELKAYTGTNKWNFDWSLYPHLAVGPTRWNVCRVAFIDRFVIPQARVDFNVGPDIPDIPVEGYAGFVQETRENLLRDLTDLIQQFRVKKGRWPRDRKELQLYGKDSFQEWDDCPDLTFTAAKGGVLRVRFTFSPEDMPVEPVKFELKIVPFH